MIKTRKKKRSILWASELSEMAICERRVFFRHRLGTRHSARQRQAMREGIQFHRALHQQAMGREATVDSGMARHGFRLLFAFLAAMAGWVSRVLAALTEPRLGMRCELRRSASRSRARR